jgi:hypothetical protein
MPRRRVTRTAAVPQPSNPITRRYWVFLQPSRGLVLVQQASTPRLFVSSRQVREGGQYHTANYDSNSVSEQQQYPTAIYDSNSVSEQQQYPTANYDSNSVSEQQQYPTAIYDSNSVSEQQQFVPDPTLRAAVHALPVPDRCTRQVRQPSPPNPRDEHTNHYYHGPDGWSTS